MGLIKRLFGGKDETPPPSIERAKGYASTGDFAEARTMANAILAAAAPGSDEAKAAQALLDRLDGIATIHGKQSAALKRAASEPQSDPNTQKPRISMRDIPPGDTK